LGIFGGNALSQVQEAEIVGRPQVEEDEITVRIKVTDANNRPVLNLNPSNFELIVDGEVTPFDPQAWKKPGEATPPPAWGIILLDFSGSMTQPDSSGVTKLDGAVEAIREFTSILEDRAGNTQLAIVPFGVGGQSCPNGDKPVNDETLNKFFAASDFNLQNFLDNLIDETPCASTNIYEPLLSAVRFLNNREDPRFYLEDEALGPDPRLFIILLSDGFHNAPATDKDQAFDQLSELIQINPNITIHTLGYGLTPEELGEKFNLGRAATFTDVTSGKVPAEEFVDKDDLARIASLTGGIAEFSGDAREIANNLQTFLDALLGEYEITYEAVGDRGEPHTVEVEVGDQNNAVISNAERYRNSDFGRTVSRSARVKILSLTLLGMLVGGVAPFWLWAQDLKKNL